MYPYQSQVKSLQEKRCYRRLDNHPPTHNSALMGAACALLSTERFPIAIQVIYNIYHLIYISSDL